MTNKPMLSVELRALLERASNNLCSGEEAYAVQQELRALLDKPDECRCKRYGKDNPHWPCPVHAEPAAQHQGYPVNRLSYSQGDRRYVNGWNDACSHWEVRSAPEAHESECTSCDGSGEYTDAIGDWRGYCTCPAGVDAEGIKGLKP